jgi:hypothetical protein
MRNRWKLTWRTGVAVIGLATTAIVVGTPTTMAQMRTEIHGAPPGGITTMPAGGSFGVGGGAGPGLNGVIVDGGGPGLVTSGGYAPPPMGPSCTVEVVGRGGRGVAQNADPNCATGGAYGPIGISGGVATYP